MRFEFFSMRCVPAISLSRFCAESNALRLNLYNTHAPIRNKPIRQRKGGKPFVKSLHIEGIMCAHCEARVQKALESLDCVKQARVSHESGTAVVALNTAADGSTLRAAVEAQDYKVLSVE